MSQGTLYSNISPGNSAARALINYLNLDIDVAVVDRSSADFVAKFPLMKCPSFESSKGFKLHQAIAITNYFVNLSEDEKIKSDLLGADIMEQASVMKWLSLAHSEVIRSAANLTFMLLGKKPYNKKEAEEHSAFVLSVASVFDQRLSEYTYLTTEHITLADLSSVCIWNFVFSALFGKETRSKFPHIVRWYNTVKASPILKSISSEFSLRDEDLKYTPPKKAEKPKKEEQPKAGKPAEAASEESAQEKKAKHPLEGLGISTFVLDDWKRKYSNEDTRPVALPWFWENYNPEEYSIWKVEYKYNDELTLTFMSNNLVGGFINRLSTSIKYMFGCLIVYGENNANGIVGAVMIRGQEFEPAFNVAPDWESYSFTKLDTTNEEQKEFINNMWAWDKPYEGKEIADGKVLK